MLSANKVHFGGLFGAAFCQSLIFGPKYLQIAYFYGLCSYPYCASLLAMEHRLPIHFIDPSHRTRAELSRVAISLGYHAEVYADCEELSLCNPPLGLIVARDDTGNGGIARLMRLLERHGVWLPVVATAANPTIARTVAAMKAGALDYLHLPLDPPAFAATLRAIGGEAAQFATARRRMFEARNRIATLSQREREVLDLLARGRSNKAIGRTLDISPRTVEIHRANMMAKLDAGHAADAVRLSIEAQLDPPAMLNPDLAPMEAA